MYQAHVWGPSLANLPISGTLNYTLSLDTNVNNMPHATPVRTIYDQNANGDNYLSVFNLEVQLGQQTKFKADVQTNSWYFYQANAVTGNLNKNSGEFHFNVNDPEGFGSCPACNFKVGGFLSGEQAVQAGVVYQYRDNDGIVHTGGAVLDKQ